MNRLARPPLFVIALFAFAAGVVPVKAQGENYTVQLCEGVTISYRSAGQPADTETLLKEMVTAAEHGDVAGRLFLGLLYKDGCGVAADLDRAVYWLNKAAESGSVAAQFELEKMRRQEEGGKEQYHQFVDQLHSSAEQGSVVAQFQLGQIYWLGEGEKQDFSQAAVWLRKAAERGYAPAQTSLGMLLRGDFLGPPNDNEAVVWLRKAASQGFPAALYNLARMHFDGRGVARDPVLAYVYLALAVDQGSEPAVKALAELESSLSDDVRHQAQAELRKRKTFGNWL